MKSLVWLAAAISFLSSSALTQEGDAPSPSSSSRLQHFRFNGRRVGGKKIAVVSFKMEPERGRRSILVPDAEGLLHPFPLSPMRHPHRFPPPFEDDERFSLNESINWGRSHTPSSQARSSLYKEEDLQERRSLVLLRQMESDLMDLEEELEKEQEREKKKNERKGRDGKSKRKKKKKGRRKGGKGGKRKKGKKQKKDKKKKKSKPPKMKGQEACQYKVLKKCAKKLGMLRKKSVPDSTDLEKCDKRKDFLDCVELRRGQSPCNNRSVARGDLPKLRFRIKKLFWTTSSCLLKESMREK